MTQKEDDNFLAMTLLADCEEYLKHYTSDYRYCDECKKLILEQQLDILKRKIIVSLRFAARVDSKVKITLDYFAGRV